MVEFSHEDHWRFMAEFAKHEVAAGGPDPHLVRAGEMSVGEPLEERIWRGGVYATVYNSPFAEAIWTAWPWERVKTEPGALLPWLQDNFHKIITRRERRTVRRPEWMGECLLGCAAFSCELPALHMVGTPEENFEVLWNAVTGVPRIGRYTAIKYTEYLRRYCGVSIRHPDMRPKGGKSPRQMLGYLWDSRSRTYCEQSV